MPSVAHATAAAGHEVGRPQQPDDGAPAAMLGDLDGFNRWLRTQVTRRFDSPVLDLTPYAAGRVVCGRRAVPGVVPAEDEGYRSKVAWCGWLRVGAQCSVARSVSSASVRWVRGDDPCALPDVGDVRAIQDHGDGPVASRKPLQGATRQRAVKRRQTRCVPAFARRSGRRQLLSEFRSGGPGGSAGAIVPSSSARAFVRDCR